MRIDIAKLLAHGVVNAFPWYELSGAEALQAVEVPPKRVSCDYSVTLAFSIANQAKRNGQSQEFYEPTYIAQRLAEELAKFSDLFAVEVSERGHLNLSAKYTWYQEMFQSIANGSGVILCDGDWSVVRGVDNCFSDSSLLPREFCCVKAESDIEPVPGAICRELAVEHKVFIDECGFSNGDSVNSKDYKLLLLAKHANIELDSRAYRMNLRGSENIPWFVDDFFVKISSFCKTTPNSPKEEMSLGSIAVADRPMYGVWKQDLYQEALVYWLAHTRGVLLDLQEHPPAEYYRKSFFHLIKGIRLFSCFYNHPQNRDLADRNSRILSRGLSEVVNQSLLEIVGKELFN